MFNVGSGEFLVIFLIALIVLGPDKLPEAARKVGKVMGDLRKMSSGFQQEMKQAMDVEGLSDLKNTFTGAAAPTLPPLAPGSSDSQPEPSDPGVSPLPSDAPTEIAASAPAEPAAPTESTGGWSPSPTPASHIPPTNPTPSDPSGWVAASSAADSSADDQPAAAPDLKSVPNDVTSSPPTSGHQGAA